MEEKMIYTEYQKLTYEEKQEREITRLTEVRDDYIMMIEEMEHDLEYIADIEEYLNEKRQIDNLKGKLRRTKIFLEMVKKGEKEL